MHNAVRNTPLRAQSRHNQFLLPRGIGKLFTAFQDNHVTDMVNLGNGNQTAAVHLDKVVAQRFFQLCHGHPGPNDFSPILVNLRVIALHLNVMYGINFHICMGSARHKVYGFCLLHG